MYAQKLQACLQQLKKLNSFDSKKASEIIDSYCVIPEEQLEPLPEKEIDNETLIEDRYIPSPQLVATFQQNKSKTLKIKPQVVNNKLKQLYGYSGVGHNLRQYDKYDSQHPMLKPSLIVEQKEETILQQLRGHKILATLPNMQSSLIENELSHLTIKNVYLNTTKKKEEQKTKKQPLEEWKKMRHLMMKNLSKN